MAAEAPCSAGHCSAWKRDDSSTLEGGEQRADCPSGVWRQDQGRWGQLEIQGIPLKCKYNLFFSCEWPNTGWSCPWSLWCSHPWKHPKGTWAHSWATDPALSRGLALGDARGAPASVTVLSHAQLSLNLLPLVPAVSSVQGGRSCELAQAVSALFPSQKPCADPGATTGTKWG